MFWLEAALEHEHRSDGKVLMAHGTLLCRYRPAGPGEWDLVDLFGEESNLESRRLGG